MTNMTIQSKDITVVVQGPIDWSVTSKYSRPTTIVLTRFLRRLLPDAKIIVSTWANQPVEGLTFDEVVFNEDPGAQGEWPSFTSNNINRQIVSTCGGLARVKTQYCLKVRTDIIIENISFIEAFETLAPLGGEKDLFDFPIVANNLTSRNTTEILNRIADHPILFHPSDHVHFGLSKDLKALWNVALQTDEDAFYFMDRTQPNRWRAHELSRLAPEQHLLTHALGKRLKGGLKTYGQISDELLSLSDYYMNSHFYFMPDRAFMHFEKYHSPHHQSFEWMRLNHHSASSEKMTKKSWIKNIREYIKLP